MTAAEKARHYRALWREQGRCVGCGRERDRDGKQCSRCRARNQRGRARWAEQGLCVTCGRERDRTDHRMCAACRTSKSAAARETNAQLRADALAAYGGTCQCCEESTPVFLDVDHVEGGGAEQRRRMTGTTFYRWLKRNGYPEGFQLLCRNCNWAKHVLGACPHKETA